VKKLGELVHRPAPGLGIDEVGERAAMILRACKVAKRGSVRATLQAQGVADPDPEAVGQAGDDHRSIDRRKDAVRGQIGMLRSLRDRILAGEECELAR